MLKLFLCDDDPLHLQHEEAYIRSLCLDAEYALEAFFYEPSLAGLSRQQIQDLFDEIYEYNIQFMPGWE